MKLKHHGFSGTSPFQGLERGPNTVLTRAYVFNVPFSWIKKKRQFNEIISYPKVKKVINGAEHETINLEIRLT